MPLTIRQYRMFNDNYGFLLLDDESGQAAVVDPADTAATLKTLEEAGCTLTAIFNTHHHADHAGGNPALLERYNGLEIYASHHDKDRIAGVTRSVGEGDRISLGNSSFSVIDIPGHTAGHIGYYRRGDSSVLPVRSLPRASGDLFCGDTLFTAGCGRIFEGTAKQLYESITKICSLPDDTRIWSAHEYTLKNLEFARSIQPDREDLVELIAAAERLLARQTPTVPSLLANEKDYNPFINTTHPALLDWFEKQGHSPATALDRFTLVRKLKDSF